MQKMSVSININLYECWCHINNCYAKLLACIGLYRKNNSNDDGLCIDG